MFFVSKSTLFDFYFYSTVAGDVPCGGRKVSSYIIILQVIFYFLWISEPILVILKIEYRLSRHYGAYAASQTILLHIKRLNQTEYPIFVILWVHCFKRQAFVLLLFYYLAQLVLP